MELFRTFHPSLAGAITVILRTEPCGNGRRTWVIKDLAVRPMHTHAGGLEIHVLPPSISKNTLNYPGFHWEHRFRVINPRRILTAHDISGLAGLFGRAIGFRVYIGGELHVLYRSDSDMHGDWCGNLPGEVGSLRVQYVVLDDVFPSTGSISQGQTIKKGQTFLELSDNDAGCLGLSLQLPTGEYVTTAVTHGFVDRPSHKASGIERTYKRCSAVIKDLTAFRLSAFSRSVRTPHIQTRERIGNSPIGKGVWRADTNTKIGTVTATYDTPSTHLPYPHGYSHDLSLVTSKDGSPIQMTSHETLPVLNGWADLATVLDGDSPVFVAAYTADQTQEDGDNVTFSTRSIVGESINQEKREAIRKEIQTALAEGYQVGLTPHQMLASVSLLWRAVDKAHVDSWAPAGGYSGSVLCAGRPTDATAKAVLFQNFEIPAGPLIPRLKNAELQQGKTKSYVDGKCPGFNIKAGYLLPREIRLSEIIYMEGEKIPHPTNSFPSRRQGMS